MTFSMFLVKKTTGQCYDIWSTILAGSTNRSKCEIYIEECIKQNQRLEELWNKMAEWSSAYINNNQQDNPDYVAFEGEQYGIDKKEYFYSLGLTDEEILSVESFDFSDNPSYSIQEVPFL